MVGSHDGLAYTHNALVDLEWKKLCLFGVLLFLKKQPKTICQKLFPAMFFRRSQPQLWTCCSWINLRIYSRDVTIKAGWRERTPLKHWFCSRLLTSRILFITRTKLASSVGSAELKIWEDWLQRRRQVCHCRQTQQGSQPCALSLLRNVCFSGKCTF